MLNPDLSEDFVMGAIKGNLRISILLLIFFFFYNPENSAQSFILKRGESIQIDKIKFEKNWITWDAIIRKELGFEEGDTITIDDLNNAITKIYNIGNFADVTYALIKRGMQNIVTIHALDAVKFFPNIGIDHSSKDDYAYNFGWADQNFLGSNTNLDLSWFKKPTGNSWNFSLVLPRQLLYKNMTISVGINSGQNLAQHIERNIIYNSFNEIDSVIYKPLMMAPFDRFEVFASIGNPWNMDHGYRFSPDISISYRKHILNDDILTDKEIAHGVEVNPFNHRMLSIGISESVGIINQKRHREDGYIVIGSYVATLGLSAASPSYNNVDIAAEYDKCINKIVQLKTRFSTGYTTAKDPYYHFIKGSSSVLGLRNGEIYGKSFYSLYLGGHFTWMNKTWLAIENACFINLGTGSDSYFNLYTKKPFLAVGTSFFFNIPVVSFLAAKVTLMFAGPGTEWFKLNI